MKATEIVSMLKLEMDSIIASISYIVNLENWTLDDYIDKMKAQKTRQDTINAVNELDESFKTEIRQFTGGKTADKRIPLAKSPKTAVTQKGNKILSSPNERPSLCPTAGVRHRPPHRNPDHPRGCRENAGERAWDCEDDPYPFQFS